jgi:hypothetical protein
MHPAPRHLQKSILRHCRLKHLFLIDCRSPPATNATRRESDRWYKTLTALTPEIMRTGATNRMTISEFEAMANVARYGQAPAVLGAFV